jgi:hypothetical protein
MRIPKTARAGLIVAAWAAASLAGWGAGAWAQDKAAPAPKEHKSDGDQCFFARNIEGFSAPDEHTLYIRVGVSDVYRLDLTEGCPDLPFREGVGLKSVPPGDNVICSPIQAEVVYREHGIPSWCQATAIHKLTPAERTALPKKDLP